MKVSKSLIVLLGSFYPMAVYANSVGLEATISSLSMKAVLASGIALIVLIGLSMVNKKRSGMLFGLMTLIIVSTSTFLIGSTIYLNSVSSSRGPVHWHASFEVWACGQAIAAHDASGNEIDKLKNPSGRLSNKIGTSTLHEHNDFRIHQEGVVVNPTDASLGNFLSVIGGNISAKSMVIPTTEGNASFVNGQKCGDDEAKVQVFAYRTNPDKTYRQIKVEDPKNYIMSPGSNVPGEDCIIIEFDREKERTDKLCRSYKVANEIGRLKGETSGN